MRKQKGMTLIGMVFTMIVVIMAAILVMRIIPVYLEHYSVVQSVKALNTTPQASLTGDPLGDAMVLRRDLSKRLDINGIQDLSDDQLTIVPDGLNKYKVKLKYQVIKPLVYNMSLMFNFVDEVEVVTGSEN